MNKQIVLLTIFILLLSSCAQNATVKSEATATSTFTPVPSATPTITPTPTNTPDPNMPAGAMGKDENGYYKDVQENGKTIRYYWVDYNYGIKGWFTSHILGGNLLNDGIPLYDYPNSQLIPFYLYVQEGIKMPYISHPQSSHQPYAPDFSVLFYTYLDSYFFNKTWIRQTADERQQFNAEFSNGQVHFKFTTSTGNYDWRLTKTTGYKFYAVKWEDADLAIHPEFYETSQGGYSWRWTVFSDPDGNLIVFDAEEYKSTNDSQKLLEDDSGVLDYIFEPMDQMLYLPTLPIKIKYWQDEMESPAAPFYTGLESNCLQVNVLNPDRSVNQTVKTCVTPHFEIIRNP